jgi:hypothetical protein
MNRRRFRPNQREGEVVAGQEREREKSDARGRERRAGKREARGAERDRRVESERRRRGIGEETPVRDRVGFG